MTDLPRSLVEFQQRFPDEAACVKYLFKVRWPEGFVCLTAPRAKRGSCKPSHGRGKRRLRQTDIGHRLDDHAPLQAAADHLVLGRLSDGHPFQRHLGAATATPARLGLLSQRLVVVRQAAPQHGRARPQHARRLGRVDEAEIPCRSKNDPRTGGGGRSHQGKMLVVGAFRSRTAGPCPSHRLAALSDYSADNLHPFIAHDLVPGTTAKTDGWFAYPGVPASNMIPMSWANGGHIVLPWMHRIFANLKVWALGVYHGLRRKHLQSYLDDSSFASTVAAPAMPRSAPCSASRHSRAHQLQDVDLTGSKSIRLRKIVRKR